MENPQISDLLRAKARILAQVIETVLDRIPTYDDLQNFTRAIIEDDPNREIILYKNQTVGVIEICHESKKIKGYTGETKFIHSV